MTETTALNGNRIDRVSVPEALQAALAHHQAGRLDEAEAVYRHILGFAPENGDALHLMGVVRLQRGNAEDAVTLIERAIAFNGGAPAYHNNLGNAFKILGKPSKAGEAYRRAITLLPGFADAHNNLGTLHLADGAAAKAEASFRRALTTAPKAAETLFNLGLALRAQDRLEEAAASFRKAVVSSPGHIEARINLSATLLGLGRLEEARCEAEAAVRQGPRHAAALTALGNVHSQEANWARTVDCYRRAIAADPGHAQAHNNLGHALSEQGQPEEAAACFQRALRLDPRYGDAQANLGSVLLRLDQVEAAAACLARAVRIAPDNAEAHYNLGQTFEQRGRVEEAETAYRRALSLKTEFPQAQTGLGNTLMVRGRLEEAEACYRRAIAHDLGRATGFYGLSRIKRFVADDPDLAAMEALAGTGGLSEKQDMHLHFALAKAYDDLGACDRAFAALSRANGLKRRDLKRRNLALDGAEADAHYRAIEGTFSAEFLARHAGLGDSAQTPVFIVGMPRSGTTLLEQILSSHPEVHGAGELLDLVGLVQGLPRRLATQTPYPACLSEAPDSLWRDLAADYLAGLSRRAPQARLVTDKLPENHQRVGLIALILPEAKIIHCRRDPVDTCLSGYKLLFTAGQRFAYDLRELGLHYRRYDRLMAHWNRVLPGRVLEVSYEDLVADQEAQTRRLLAHCGLDWDPLCLRFHEFDRKIMTASATQVRRPIYRDSVRNWRRYEKHLAPLLEALGELAPAD